MKSMTSRGFLNKSNTKAAASASAFLQAHREFLSTGELAPLTGPILAKIDSLEVMPTPGLEQIKQVVLAHLLASQQDKAFVEAAPRVYRHWVVTIFNGDGEMVSVQKDGKSLDLQEEFEKPQDADRWADRRLFDGESDWFAVVQHATQLNKHGELLSTTILRQDSIARILSKKSGPAVKSSSKSSGKLGWGVKSRPSHAKFSHG